MGDGKARFEIKRTDHDHLLDVETGQIHEFKSQELQRLIKEIADEMGFDLTEHRLEIYGRKQGRTACRCYEIKIYWVLSLIIWALKCLNTIFSKCDTGKENAAPCLDDRN